MLGVDSSWGMSLVPCYKTKNIDEVGTYIACAKPGHTTLTGTFPSNRIIDGSWYEGTLVRSYADTPNFNCYQEMIEYFYEHGVNYAVKRWWRCSNYGQGWGAWTAM